MYYYGKIQYGHKEQLETPQTGWNLCIDYNDSEIWGRDNEGTLKQFTGGGSGQSSIVTNGQTISMGELDSNILLQNEIYATKVTFRNSGQYNALTFLTSASQYSFFKIGIYDSDGNKIDEIDYTKGSNDFQYCTVPFTDTLLVTEGEILYFAIGETDGANGVRFVGSLVPISFDPKVFYLGGAVSMPADLSTFTQVKNTGFSFELAYLQPQIISYFRDSSFGWLFYDTTGGASVEIDGLPAPLQGNIPDTGYSAPYTLVLKDAEGNILDTKTPTTY